MTVRIVHGPCHQPIDITDDNRLMQPDTDTPHQCPVTEGRYSVVRHWHRWTIEDVLDTHLQHPIYDTQAEAHADADQRNKTDHARRQPRTPQPAQPDLFSNQEATG